MSAPAQSDRNCELVSVHATTRLEGAALRTAFKGACSNRQASATALHNLRASARALFALAASRSGFAQRARRVAALARAATIAPTTRTRKLSTCRDRAIARRSRTKSPRRFLSTVAFRAKIALFAPCLRIVGSDSLEILIVPSSKGPAGASHRR